jgi:hypothetical protein
VTVSINLDVTGVEQLTKGLEAAPGVLDAANEEALSKAILILEAAVKAGTPRVTGRLFASINGRVSSGPGTLRGSVGTTVNYGSFVESGRGPITAHHLTQTGKRGFLRFRGRGGAMIYRRSVGPMAGRHMFAAGLAASAGAIRETFREAARRVAESIRGK